jgi:hypothetical protein
MPRSPIPYVTRPCRRSHSRTSGAEFKASVTVGVTATIVEPS